MTLNPIGYCRVARIATGRSVTLLLVNLHQLLDEGLDPPHALRQQEAQRMHERLFCLRLLLQIADVLHDLSHTVCVCVYACMCACVQVKCLFSVSFDRLTHFGQQFEGALCTLVGMLVSQSKQFRGEDGRHKEPQEQEPRHGHVRYVLSEDGEKERGQSSGWVKQVAISLTTFSGPVKRSATLAQSCLSTMRSSAGHWSTLENTESISSCAYSVRMPMDDSTTLLAEDLKRGAQIMCIVEDFECCMALVCLLTDSANIDWTVNQ